MKKYLLLGSLVLVLFVTAGCGDSQKKKDEAMKKYVTEYYTTYIKDKVTGLDIPEITIGNLKAAVEVGAEYDMDKLKDCADSSYASLILDDKGDITEVELHMNCK